MEIGSNRIINICASATFGIFLIHANSDTMRHFLWVDTLHNSDYFRSNYLWVHAILSLAGVYIICLLIDLGRIYLVERPICSILTKYSIAKRLRGK